MFFGKNKSASLLSLGPAFCLENDLKEEIFECEVEEMIAKAKWDLMGEELKARKEGVDWSKSMDILFDEICTDEENLERIEEEKFREGLSRMPHNIEDNSFSYARRRVTDAKGNSRVHLPKLGKDLDLEARLEMTRVQLMAAFRSYSRRVSAPGHGGGEAKGSRKSSNLSKSEARGLKSLKKRVKEGEIVLTIHKVSKRKPIESKCESL